MHDLAVLAVGLWALGALAILPRAWGWDDWNATPKFDGDLMLVALCWPALVPSVAVLSILALAIVGACFLARRARRWWAADWSVGAS